MKPLDSSQLLTIDQWLEMSNYPINRKVELRKLYTKMQHEGFNFFSSKGSVCRAAMCKCFIKDEPYSKYKYPRGIFSRNDIFKIYCAPYFKSIENVLFKRKEFIKKIPVLDRPSYIMKHYICGTSVRDEINVHTLNTDYSSYECSFSKEMMESCEFVLYDYMLRDLPDSSNILSVFRQVLTGVNVLKFRNVTAKVKARRMSGEMNTSLGNGFSNLMIYLYLCELKQAQNMFVLVEGDDLLAQYNGPLFTIADYQQFGLIVKTIYLNGPNEASFCGQLFDTETKTVVTDPVKVILNLGWTDMSYCGSRQKRKLELLRAKALSYAYQYYQCPIIYPMAQAFIRLTNGSRYRFSHDQYKESFLQEMLVSKIDIEYRNVSMSSRIFMASRFGVSIADQISIEKYFDSLQAILPLSCEAFEKYLVPIYSEFDARYVKQTNTFLAFRSDLTF